MLSAGVTPVNHMKGKPPASRLQSGVNVRILPVWWLSTRKSTTKSFGPSSLTVGLLETVKFWSFVRGSSEHPHITLLFQQHI